MSRTHSGRRVIRVPFCPSHPLIPSQHQGLSVPGILSPIVEAPPPHAIPVPTAPAGDRARIVPTGPGRTSCKERAKGGAAPGFPGRGRRLSPDALKKMEKRDTTFGIFSTTG